MRIKKLISLFVLLSFFTYHRSIAQTGQFWSQFSLNYNASPKWKLTTDAMARYQLAKDGWQSYVFREAATYKVNPKMALVGGTGFYLIDYVDEESYQEFRIWEGLQARWPKIGPWEFTHYVRLEEKFIFHGPNSPYVTRFRYNIGGGMPLLKWNGGNGVLSASVNFEPMWLLNNSIGDLYSYTHRFYYGLGTRFSSKWGVDVFYISQGFKASQEEHFYHTYDVGYIKLTYTL